MAKCFVLHVVSANSNSGNSYMPWEYVLAVQYNEYYYITVITYFQGI
jgi:hypothetical protein